jgi:DNA-binding NtrC family response regulator
MKLTFEGLAQNLMESGFFLEEAVELLEKALIVRALELTAGNRCAASKMLGIHRNTLQKKMGAYKLHVPEPARKPARKAGPAKDSRSKRSAS